MQNNAILLEKHVQSNIASLSEVCDEQLIKQIENHSPNSQEAMETLIERHQHWILHRCTKKLCNYHDAQDVTQEVLLRLYRGLSGFEGRANFRNWLFSIVENQCRSFIIQRANHAMTNQVQTEIVKSEETRYSHSDTSWEDSEVFSLTLANLPFKAREILQLRFIQELSLEDIAQTLSIGLSATKMRLCRAIELYQQCYTTLYTCPSCSAAA